MTKNKLSREEKLTIIKECQVSISEKAEAYEYLSGTITEESTEDFVSLVMLTGKIIHNKLVGLVDELKELRSHTHIKD